MTEVDGRWDNLNITYPVFLEKIKKFAKDTKYKLVESKPIKQGQTTTYYRLNLLITGQGECLIDCWQKKSGLSIRADIGNQQKLGIDICNSILNKVSQTENKHKNFPTISGELYIMLSKSFQEKYSYEENIEKATGKINAKIKKNNFTVFLSYFPTTGTLYIQGKSGCLWDSVLLDILNETTQNPEEIIEEYFKTQEQLEKCSIKCDNGLLAELSMKLVGDNVYNDGRIFKDYERKWFHTSTFFHYTEIDLEDNCHSVASSVKIIEGLLRRIFNSKGIPSDDCFNQFDKDETSTKHQLKRDYIHKFDPASKKHIEDLYKFITKVRNDLFHDAGEGEKTLNKAKSIAIFNDIISLLKKSHELADNLFG